MKVIDQFFFKVNGAARNTDNKKLHNEKTPQLTKYKRYDRLKRKRAYQASWKERNPWVETSALKWQADNSGDLISLEYVKQHQFKLDTCGCKKNIGEPYSKIIYMDSAAEFREHCDWVS